MREPQQGVRSSGFSLIELMIAMVVTLVISGAIYGLMAGGQTAFRREPALVERQQNIRIAMDLLMRDVQNGGLGMTADTQVFTRALDNWNQAGSPLSSLTAPERAYLALGGAAGATRADALEILANDASCPTLTACSSVAGNMFITEALPACLSPTAARGSLVYVSGSSGPAVSLGPAGVLMLFPTGAAGCGNGRLAVPNGQAPTLNPAGTNACANGTNNRCSFVSALQLVRYQIAPENPAAPANALTNPPCLWRSDSGLINYDGSAGTNPPGSGGVNNPWRLIARGIEDLQFQYQSGAEWPATPNLWLDQPPVVVTGTLTTVVQRVRITLSGYAVGVNVGGETQGAVAGAAGAARRGQLTTIVTPRAALQVAYTANAWR